jgi:hypothetical protein
VTKYRQKCDLWDICSYIHAVHFLMCRGYLQKNKFWETAVSLANVLLLSWCSVSSTKVNICARYFSNSVGIKIRLFTITARKATNNFILQNEIAQNFFIKDYEIHGKASNKCTMVLIYEKVHVYYKLQLKTFLVEKLFIIFNEKFQ